MTEYRVRFDRTGKSSKRIEAKKFDIEDGGVLVFYDERDSIDTLQDMNGDVKIRAFNRWDEVERL